MVFTQCLDLLGRRRRAFRQALYLVRYHRKAAAGITGHGGLDRRVQSQNVGLVGDVVDQAHNVTNLLGRFTQTLDPFGGVLDLLANGVHAGDGVLHHLVTLVGDGYRALCYRRGFGGVGRYLVNRHGHLVYRRRGASNFLRLMLGGLGQMHCRALGFLSSGGYLQGGFVNGLYQGAQLVDGEVDGVGDGPGKVFGYRSLGGQVTVGKVGNFVQQTQNRGLVLSFFSAVSARRRRVSRVICRPISKMLPSATNAST